MLNSKVFYLWKEFLQVKPILYLSDDILNKKNVQQNDWNKP